MVVESETLLKIVKSCNIHPKRVASASMLSEIKRIIVNGRKFHGAEKFLIDGKEIHRRILEPETEPEKDFDVEDRARFKQIEELALAEPLVEYLLTNAITEEYVEKELYGVPFKGYLDIRKELVAVGADLKTTSATSRANFISKCREYGYYRQAHIYKKLADLEEFLFIGIRKKEPYGLYILDTSAYPEEMAYAAEEVEMLCDVYKRCLAIAA